MNQHSGESFNWLVRSSGRILGPFSDAELEEKILRKEISIIDEISTPWQRWNFVREFPMFYDAVEKVRQSVSVSDGSMTNIADELTKTGYKITTSAESSGIDSSTESTNSKSKNFSENKIKTLSSSSEENLDSKFLIFAKYFFAMSLLAFSFFVLYKRYFAESNVNQKISFQDLVTDKDKVIYYEGLLVEKKINYDQFHELVLLKISTNESSANVKNLLDQAGILFPAIRNQDYQVLQGMLALHEQDYAAAASFFQNAQNEEAQVNFLISLYGQKKYEELIQKVQTSSFKDPELQSIVNQIKMLSFLKANKEIDLKNLAEASAKDRYSNLNEILLLIKGLSKKNVSEILKKDLIFHQRFVDKINVSNQWLRSFFYLDVCKSHKAIVSEIQLACLLLVRNITEAKPILKELELSKPQSVTVQLLSVYYDLVSNQIESARVKSKVLPEASSFLELFYKSEQCFQNKDVNCFLNLQSKILNFENRNEWKRYFDLQVQILKNSSISMEDSSFLPIRQLKVTR